MIRNFDLIRKILLDVQSSPAGTSPFRVEFPGEYEQSVVNEHVLLLIEAGLLRGRALRATNGIADISVQGLTWSGHDFIDVAKDETLWANAKASVLKPAVAVTFEALLQWLKAEALKRLGLD